MLTKFKIKLWQQTYFIEHKIIKASFIIKISNHF